MTEAALFELWRVAQTAGRLAPTWAVVAAPDDYPTIAAGLREVLGIKLSDQILVEPEPGKRTLAKARLLPWLAAAQLTPRGSRQLAVLIAAERLEAVAANILLKTLEEPPPGTVFLLLMERDALIPTVRSRLQLVRVENDDDSFQRSELPETFSAILKWAGEAEEQSAWTETVVNLLESSRARLSSGHISPRSVGRVLALATAAPSGINRRLQLIAALTRLKT